MADSVLLFQACNARDDAETRRIGMASDHIQKAAFLRGEGDRWFERNADHLSHGKQDVVVEAMTALDLRPSSILEIGAANGHRLAALAALLGARCAGVEPSAQAVEDGLAVNPHVDLRIGAADELPFEAGAFDLVILGFCMYLVDPKLHLKAVAEADRVLADGGALIVFDFITAHPYFNDYAHLPGLRANKMEFSRLFTAHPAYTLVHRQLDRKSDQFLDADRREGVDVLMKNFGAAFPPNPHRR